MTQESDKSVCLVNPCDIFFVVVPLSDEGIDVEIVDGKMKEENEAAVPVEQDSMISSGKSSHCKYV